MNQQHVFPKVKSLAAEAKKAKEEVDEVMKKIAAVKTERSKLEAVLHSEYEKFGEAEQALKKAHRHLEGINEEHVALPDEVHELQAGQPLDRGRQQRASEPLQQDQTPSQSVVEQERGSSLAASESFRSEKKVAKSWDSWWKPLIARQRCSLPRPVQAVQAGTTSELADSLSESDGERGATRATTDSFQRMTPGLLGGSRKKASCAVTAQEPIAASNESGRRTNNAAALGSARPRFSGPPAEMYHPPKQTRNSVDAVLLETDNDIPS
ncbi:hypothetical protein FRC00_000850 [Tulasnella sp. 408]|nr:hypothetical protein FRC00_000850 [Tulasnella sp. 408]